MDLGKTELLGKISVAFGMVWEVNKNLNEISSSKTKKGVGKH